MTPSESPEEPHPPAANLELFKSAIQTKAGMNEPARGED